MYQISTLNKISKVGLAHLNEEYIITETIEKADGILVRSQDMKTMDFSEELMAIARAGAGVNNIPLKKCAEKGIVVFNTPGANANAVKELVLSALFMTSRNIPAALAWTSSLTEDVAKTVEKGKSQFVGHEIIGKTIGIIGLGAIGRKIATATDALGMKVLGYDPFFAPEMDELTIYKDMMEMIPLCDYITIHVPGNDSTKGMINKEVFDKMKDGAILLNFARGDLVNDVDMLVALETGKLAKYMADFPTETLVGRDKVILLPHLGASTEEAEDNCATMAVEELRNYFENGNVINSVNFAKVDMGAIEKGSKRISVLTSGHDDPVASILADLNSSGIKVNKIAGGNRDGFGYVLAEVEAADLLGVIFTDPHIIRYRVIEG